MATSPSVGRAITVGAFIGFLAVVVAVAGCLAAVLLIQLPHLGEIIQTMGSSSTILGLVQMAWLGLLIMIGGAIGTGWLGVLAGVTHALTTRRLWRGRRAAAHATALLGSSLGLLVSVPATWIVERIYPLWGKEWVRSAWVAETVGCSDAQSFTYALGVLAPVGLLVGTLAGWVIQHWLCQPESTA